MSDCRMRYTGEYKGCAIKAIRVATGVSLLQAKELVVSENGFGCTYYQRMRILGHYLVALGECNYRCCLNMPAFLTNDWLPDETYEISHYEKEN